MKSGLYKGENTKIAITQKALHRNSGFYLVVLISDKNICFIPHAVIFFFLQSIAEGNCEVSLFLLTLKARRPPETSRLFHFPNNPGTLGLKQITG